MRRSVIAVVAGLAVVTLGIAGKFALLARLAPAIVPAPGEDQFPSGFWMIVLLISDLAVLILGGYATASIAGRAELTHATLLGVAVSVLGLASLLTPWGLDPMWYQVVLLALAVPAAVVGGSLGIRS